MLIFISMFHCVMVSQQGDLEEAGAKKISIFKRQERCTETKFPQGLENLSLHYNIMHDKE